MGCDRVSDEVPEFVGAVYMGWGVGDEGESFSLTGLRGTRLDDWLLQAIPLCQTADATGESKGCVIALTARHFSLAIPIRYRSLNQNSRFAHFFQSFENFNLLNFLDL